MKKIILVIVATVFFVSCAKVEDKNVKSPVKKDSVKVEKNVAQKYIDVQKSNIDKAKASMEKSNKAQEDQNKELENIMGN